MEVIGASFDSGVKHTTKRIMENGFNPKWEDEFFEFTVYNPHFALLRFVVQSEDVFGEPNFIGQATYPVSITNTHSLITSLVLMFEYILTVDLHPQRLSERMVEKRVQRGSRLSLSTDTYQP